MAASTRAFVLRHTRLRPVPGLEEVRLHLADEALPTWHAVTDPVIGQWPQGNEHATGSRTFRTKPRFDRRRVPRPSTKAIDLTVRSTAASAERG